jgi:hypothetical protein
MGYEKMIFCIQIIKSVIYHRKPHEKTRVHLRFLCDAPGQAGHSLALAFQREHRIAGPIAGQNASGHGL